MASIDRGLDPEVEGASPMSAKSAAPKVASVQFTAANQEGLMQPSITISTRAHGQAKLWRAAVLAGAAAVVAMVLINSAASINILESA